MVTEITRSAESLKYLLSGSLQKNKSINYLPLT